MDHKPPFKRCQGDRQETDTEAKPAAASIAPSGMGLDDSVPPSTYKDSNQPPPPPPPESDGASRLTRATALIDRLERILERADNLMTGHCPGCGSWRSTCEDGCDLEAALAAVKEWREGK